jgi:tetratricopeptide (TPR) repeat protein
MLAWHSDIRTEFGEGVSYAGTHNLHMLFYAGSMDGQGAVSISAAKEYANQVPDGVFYESLVLMRFGKFDEILALTQPPTRDFQRGLWEVARGYALLRAGEVDSAKVYLQRVDEAARTISPDVKMRVHTAQQLLGVTGDILRGEILRSEGKLDEAIAAFQRGVATQDGLTYDEPEPLPFAARHWLGAALLEAGRPAEAEAVYETSLERHPHNGWALFGLEQAQRAQGKTAEANATKAEFARQWVNADVMIRSSRF